MYDQNTCLLLTQTLAPSRFGLDRFYCIWLQL